MSARIIDGKAIAATIREQLAQEVATFVAESSVQPHLVAMLVGDDPASAVYVRNKQRACEKAGIRSTLHRLPADTSQNDLLKLVRECNADAAVHGILVQLPLPEQIDEKAVLDTVTPLKDVDAFHPENVGLIVQGRPRFLPCTPHGIQQLLIHSDIETSGRHTVVLGRSEIVGKPMAILMMQKGIAADSTVTVCHSRTQNLVEITRSADILIAAIGRPEFVTAEMVQPGAVVIDVGINRVDDRLVGDVAFEPLREIASAITPVPGGVGPMTIAMLLKNTLAAARLAGGAGLMKFSTTLWQPAAMMTGRTTASRRPADSFRRRSAIVSRELKRLGYEDQRVEDGRVTFTAGDDGLCRANIHLRCAERVLLKLGEFDARDFDALFEGTRAIEWADIFPVDAEFPVGGKSVRSQLASVPACQSIVKKAIVEKMRERYRLERFPETGAKFAVEFSILKDRVTIGLDASGAGLHKRGYRTLTGNAPLRETLAAALISLSYWNRERPLIDPFCGTGTLPIEAAMIGRNIAPGLNREFAAESWPIVPPETWEATREEARAAITDDLAFTILGTDIDSESLRMARYHAESAGVADSIHFQQKPFAELTTKRQYGCVICNPPYGERSGELADAEEFLLVTDSLDVHLASDAERVAIYRNVHEFWGRGLSLDEHVARRLASEQHNRATWIAGCVNGKVVSSMGCYPLPFCLRGDVVPGIAIGAVHTLPDYRGRGFAPRMFEWVEDHFRSQGVVISLLYSDIDPAYYARLGYIECPAHEAWIELNPSNAEFDETEFRLEAFDAGDDVAYLRKSYSDCHGIRPISIHRTEDYWGFLVRKDAGDLFFRLRDSTDAQLGYVRIGVKEQETVAGEKPRLIWKLRDAAIGRRGDDAFCRLMRATMNMAAAAGASTFGGWMPNSERLQSLAEMTPRKDEITMLKSLTGDVILDPDVIASTDHFQEIDHV
eukprot:g8387.t1